MQIISLAKLFLSIYLTSKYHQDIVSNIDLVVYF